ncbi:MAG: flavin reductase family protein [Pseudomonadota bacterium]
MNTSRLKSNPVDRTDVAAFIAAMRDVASSITVVTSQGISGAHGATVSAFCSVSADPPQVLVCLNAQSRIAEIVQANGCFCVNLLTTEQQMIADRFAGRHGDRINSRFDGIDCDWTNACGPAFPGSTWFGCRLHQVIPSGSHLICIGQVERLHSGQGAPLIWLDGEYHQALPESSFSSNGVLRPPYDNTDGFAHAIHGPL